MMNDILALTFAFALGVLLGGVLGVVGVVVWSHIGDE